MEEFGFETFETYTTGKSTFVYGGKVTRFEAPLLPLPVTDLTEIAATITQFDLMAAEVPVDAPWTAPQAAAWDAQTVATWLDDNIITAGARAALDVMTGGALCAAPRELSLLHYLFLVASTGGAERLISIKGGVLESRVVGGTGVIIDTLTAKLGDQVLLNAPVRQIDQTGASVQLTSDRGAISADRVIVAVPPTIAGRDRLRSAAARDPGWPDAAFPDGLGDQGLCVVPDTLLAGGRAQRLRQQYRSGRHRQRRLRQLAAEREPRRALRTDRGRRRTEWGPRPAAERKAAVLEAFRHLLRAAGARAERLPGAGLGQHALDSGWGDHGLWSGHLDGVRGRPADVGGAHPLGRHGDGYKHWGSMDGAISAAVRAVHEVLA